MHGWGSTEPDSTGVKDSRFACPTRLVGGTFHLKQVDTLESLDMKYPEPEPGLDELAIE